MNIKHFETGIPNVIIKRGRDYFRHGHVLNLFEKTEGNWQAEVDGTYIYSVNVELCDFGEIIGSSCNCPYDWGNYCKHEAAVFFALQKAFGEQKTKEIKKETITLQQLLETKSKEELIQLILGTSSNDRRLYNQLLSELNQPENEIKTAQEVILYHIDKAENNGFIAYNKISEALEGVNLTLDRAKEKLENLEFELVINLSLMSLKHAVDVLDYSKDSYEDIGAVIERSLIYTEEATEKGVKKWSRGEKESIFEEIIERALDEQLEGWIDWRIELLTICIPFCKEAKFKSKLNAVLESLLNQVKSESWDDKYNKGKLKEVQLNIILRSKDTNAIETFLLNNIGDSNIRGKAILYSLGNKGFQKKLQLKIESQQ